jgi:hypothetical protein
LSLSDSSSGSIAFFDKLREEALVAAEKYDEIPLISNYVPEIIGMIILMVSNSLIYNNLMYYIAVRIQLVYY